MIVTTTPNVEGKQISQYLGIVTQCSIFAVPGGAKMIQRGWRGSFDAAIEELTQQAEQLGADAIVGVIYNAYKSGMVDYLHVTGTAVKF